MNYEIRNYQRGDEEFLRKICLDTCEEKLESKAKRESLCLRYVDYYYQNETVFVAVDGENRPIGYILCATDYRSYRKRMKPYLRRIFQLDKRGWITYLAEMAAHGFFAKYPAHLHIDILPAYQKEGIGTALTERLFSFLREQKKDVHLLCGAGNKKGNAFYRKRGFRRIFRGFGVVVYGKNLSETF